MHADPAWPDSLCFNQPDSTTLWIIECGDEFYNWVETTDGYVIVQNSHGVFEYAEIINNQMAPSEIKVHNVHERTKNEVDYAVRQQRMVSNYISNQHQSIRNKFTARLRTIAVPTSPVIGTRKILTILVGFVDKPFTYTQTDFDNLMNQTGYSVNGNHGSVKDYYKENSYNQLNLVSTVIGPFIAQDSSKYYVRPNGGSSANSVRLVQEAINWADLQGVDFSDYDGDNDGYVDCIHIVFAGNRYSATGNGIIWPYHSTLPTSIQKDGVYLSEYICTPEMLDISDNSLTTIGTICHEIGHVLGAPDFYPVGINGNARNKLGTGLWDVMANGNILDEGRCPSHHNAYTKTEIFKWLSPITINPNTQNDKYEVLTSSQNQVIYRVNTNTTGEYYLLENRQKILFDSLISDNGLLIYHIDASINSSIANNTVNTALPQKCYLANPFSSQVIPSDTSSYGDRDKAVFPNSELQTLYNDAGSIFFTSQSTPRSQSWAGEATGVDICFIQRDGVNIKFVVNPEIEGPDELCDDTAMYYISNVPSNASVSWSYERHGNPDPIRNQQCICIEELTTDTAVILRKCKCGEIINQNNSSGRNAGEEINLFPPSPGSLYCSAYATTIKDTVVVLTATISSGTNSYTMTKRIRIPFDKILTVYSEPTGNWTVGTSRTFNTCDYFGKKPDEIYWYINQLTPTTSYYDEGNGETFTCTPPTAGTYALTMLNYDACDDYVIRHDTLTVYPSTRALYANPVNSSQADITIVQEEQPMIPREDGFRLTETNNNEETYILELWHEKMGCVRRTKTSDSHAQIDVRDLPKGIYILLLKQQDGTIVDSNKMIIEN